MKNFGINQIGIPKFQHPWRTLLVSKNSGTWGDRGKGNELQSALEKGLSWIGDRFINAEEYLEEGIDYLFAAPLAVLTGKPKEIPRVIERMRELRNDLRNDPRINLGVVPYDLISSGPIKGGWMLKGLMKGSQLEKQLSKAGTISINGLQAYLKKASKLEQDVIGKVLNNKFAGLKNIDYNALKKAVSDELITYSRVPQTKYENYGIERLGFGQDPVKFNTFTFESPRIPIGNGKHYDRSTLGFSRTFTNPKEPDILYVLESQSDLALAKNSSEAVKIFNNLLKRIFELEAKPNKTIYDKIDLEDLKRLKQDLINLNLNLIVEPLLLHLKNNYLQRQLQENMIFGAELGLKRMRYPTSDTAAKIEGFKKVKRTPTTKEVELYLLENNPQFKLDTERFNYLRKLREKGTITPDEYSEMGSLVSRRDKAYLQGHNALTTMNYTPEHQTILKKYSDFPKMFDKLFKGLEVRIVTDAKGNTWYEVDIPENFLLSEWLFKKGGVLGLNKIIGIDKNRTKKIDKSNRFKKRR